MTKLNLICCLILTLSSCAAAVPKSPIQSSFWLFETRLNDSGSADYNAWSDCLNRNINNIEARHQC